MIVLSDAFSIVIAVWFQELRFYIFTVRQNVQIVHFVGL
jgi:hypothetical protein